MDKREEIAIKQDELNIQMAEFDLGSMKERHELDMLSQKQEIVRRGIETAVSVLRGGSVSLTNGGESISSRNIKLANEKLEALLNQLGA